MHDTQPKDWRRMIIMFLRCPSDRIRALGRGSVLFFEWSALALIKAARVNKTWIGCNFGDPDC